MVGVLISTNCESAVRATDDAPAISFNMPLECSQHDDIKRAVQVKNTVV